MLVLLQNVLLTAS